MTKDKSLTASRSVPKSKKSKIYRRRVKKQTINKNKKLKKSLKERRLLLGGERRCQDIDVKYLKKTPSQILNLLETEDELEEPEQINFLKEIFRHHVTPSGDKELSMSEQLFLGDLNNKRDTEKQKICLYDNNLEVLLEEYYFLISSESSEGLGREVQNESFNNFKELPDERKDEVKNLLLSDLTEYCIILISALKLEIEPSFEDPDIRYNSQTIQDGGGIIGKIFLFFILFFGIINSTMASNFFRNPQMRVAIRKNISSKISDGVDINRFTQGVGTTLDLIKPLKEKTKYEKVKKLSTSTTTEQVTLLAHQLFDNPKFNDLFQKKIFKDVYRFKKVGKDIIRIKKNIESLKRGERGSMEGIMDLSSSVTDLIIDFGLEKVLMSRFDLPPNSLTQFKELKGELEFAYKQSNIDYPVPEGTQEGHNKFYIQTIFNP